MRLSIFSVVLCFSFLPFAVATPIVEDSLNQHLITQFEHPHISTHRTHTTSRWYSSILAWLRREKSRRVKQEKDVYISNQAALSSTRYGDDVLVRFKFPPEDATRKAFMDAVDTMYLDLWEAKDDWADVRISKEILPAFLTLLPSTMQKSYVPLLSDLSQAVFDTYPSATKDSSRTSSSAPRDLFFENYQPLSVIYPWLMTAASMVRDKTELFTIGTSYEGRDIPAFKIGLPPADDGDDEPAPRHTILITAGTHAREWISISTAIFIIRSLLSPPSDPATTHKILEHYDIVVVPILNPDGYEYTWTTDRLWRKSRQTTPLPFCPGLDLDRSFPFSWDGDSQADNPCSESYAGEFPLQAVEAQRLVEWAANETNNGNRVFSSFIDLHSYSQQILYPYSYTCDRAPRNIEDLEELAFGLSKAFRLASGHFYDVSSACDGSLTIVDSKSTATGNGEKKVVKTSLQASGGSLMDYMFATLGVRHSFQIKLRDTGSYGFLLPRSEIVPTGEEAFEGILGLGRWLLGNRGIEGATITAPLIEDSAEVSVDDGDDGLQPQDGVIANWWNIVRRRR